MARVVVSQFVTVDGVFEDPGGSEKQERAGAGPSPSIAGLTVTSSSSTR
jgi:hypothetical protein